MAKKLFLVSFLVLVSAFAKAQTRASLEKRKAAIQAEINQFSQLLKNVKKEEATVLLRVETTQRKIASTQEIINITNKQANLITRSINENKAQIKKLDEEVKSLKADYAEMIVKSYKRNNERSRLMFLLSSEDFLQAYKRVQYLQSYANYRKKQADEIKEKSDLLVEKNEQLDMERKEKVQILAANKKQREVLRKDKEEQEKLLKGVKENEAAYAATIREKAKERASIDREIKKLIAADIAKSNKGKGTKSSTTKFFLSPEAKALAANFKGNRGKLPWPVAEGFISMRYGTQPSPIVKSLKIKSNGLRFQAPKDAKVRAVFDGEVVHVLRNKYGILSIHVRHGNYTSIYNNLKSVEVQKGDKVTTLDILGEVFTDRSDVTELQFVLLEESQTLDPARWLLKN
ncbi:MAG: peptidoglycan DD-metalloendopeptidase family protein [Nonlabens sp.]